MDASNTALVRYVALDVHKQYVMVAAIDAHQNVLIKPLKLAFDQFEQWCRQHLYATDAVVLEATTNAWQLYDQLEPLVASVTVANPYLVKLITAARVKTDAHDTIRLARLLLAGLIPAVWVPPAHVRELRSLVAHRKRLIHLRTQARNRLHAVLHRHNLVPPAGEIFRPCHRAWWQTLNLCASECLSVKADLAVLDSLEPIIRELEAEIIRLSQQPQWATPATFLIQLPGIGVLTAMVLLGAIGDITRFPSAKHLVGYSGLGASVHASGQTYHTGGITKQGRRELRSAMVEAAWQAVQYHPHWKVRFEHLSARLGSNKAIVAIARKLLVIVWHVLTKQVVDQHALDAYVARKLMTWAWKLGREGRQGLKVGVFVRQELVRLKIGAGLDGIYRGKQKHAIPSSEVLTG